MRYVCVLPVAPCSPLLVSLSSPGSLSPVWVRERERERGEGGRERGGERGRTEILSGTFKLLFVIWANARLHNTTLATVSELHVWKKLTTYVVFHCSQQCSTVIHSKIAKSLKRTQNTHFFILRGLSLMRWAFLTNLSGSLSWILFISFWKCYL